jgi:hypothetical protein
MAKMPWICMLHHNILQFWPYIKHGDLLLPWQLLIIYF